MKLIASILWGTSMVIVVMLCISQFCVDNFWPFAIAFLTFILVWRFRPSLRIALGLVLGLGLAIFIADCAILGHRVSVELRTWAAVWDSQEIVDILPSPTGRSTAYIIGGGFLDSAFWVYISDGGIFPKHSYIGTAATDASYPKDIAGSWSGEVFSIARLRYDEKTRRIDTLPQSAKSEP